MNLQWNRLTSSNSLLGVLVFSAVIVSGICATNSRTARVTVQTSRSAAVPPPLRVNIKSVKRSPVVIPASINETLEALQNNGSSTPSSGSTKSSARNREQYLFNVFEVIISTLESKLQRIENLDKAVEHLMRRIESIDSRVSNNIVKTDSVISKLRLLDQKLFQTVQNNEIKGGPLLRLKEDEVGKRLNTLDKKVSDIDKKVHGLTQQIDANVLAEDINAEGSEKKPVSMHISDISKTIGNDVKSTLESLDRKWTYQLASQSESVHKVLEMVEEIHFAIVEPHAVSNTTTPPPPPASKIDRLVQKMSPILSVSEKMDEVWDVVVGTKSSVDGLVPKSDELLTQTQRQERAISNIHEDLRSKANKIIENLNMVDKRLKKQENEVMHLATRPVPAEYLLDPTIDRLVEYDNSRYSLEGETELPPIVTFNTTPLPTSSPSAQSPPATPSSVTGSNTTVAGSKVTHRGIIFPSVKNKPTITNNTFTTDMIATIKDIKGYSCADIHNAGMRESGVYYLQIRGTTYWFLKVYCEQIAADGGWTVIQRRDDYGEPRENFNRDWVDYKNGFGDPGKEFWLGNENIYMLTNNEDYILRIDLEDFEGNKRYAQYSHFKIYSEAEYYKLEIDGYEGNAGDSLNDPWYGSNNSPFSTYNRDNDRSSLNCASMLKGGWWWKSCGRGLNGLYLNDPQDITARQGIVWFRWRGWDYTLKRATMMIKPRGLVTTNTTT